MKKVGGYILRTEKLGECDRRGEMEILDVIGGKGSHLTVLKNGFRAFEG